MYKLSKVLIVYNSELGYLGHLCEAEKRGIEAAGGTADIRRIANFYSRSPKCDDLPGQVHHPVIEPIELLEYDAILFGIATAQGSSTSSDWRAFWDKTGQLWVNKSFLHKAAGAFVSCGTLASGQDNIFTTLLTALVHHGMYFLPLGYKFASGLLEDISEMHGGTAWGAGTFMGIDGTRQPSKRELEIAEIQGRTFYKSLRNVMTANPSALLGPC